MKSNYKLLFTLCAIMLVILSVIFTIIPKESRSFETFLFIPILFFLVYAWFTIIKPLLIAFRIKKAIASGVEDLTTQFTEEELQYKNLLDKE